MFVFRIFYYIIFFFDYTIYFLDSQLLCVVLTKYNPKQIVSSCLCLALAIYNFMVEMLNLCIYHYTLHISCLSHFNFIGYIYHWIYSNLSYVPVWGLKIYYINTYGSDTVYCCGQFYRDIHSMIQYFCLNFRREQNNIIVVPMYHFYDYVWFYYSKT